MGERLRGLSSVRIGRRGKVAAHRRRGASLRGGPRLGPRVTSAYFPAFPRVPGERGGTVAWERGSCRRRRRNAPAARPFGAWGWQLLRGREGSINMWVMAQQHPGEAMAGWFMEGLVGRLGGPEREGEGLLARAGHLPRAPHGSRRLALGNRRTNAAGLDLATVGEPVARGGPRSSASANAMARRGSTCSSTCTATEPIPYVFAQGTSGVPRRAPRTAQDQRVALLREPPLGVVEFPDRARLPDDAPGRANLASDEPTTWPTRTTHCVTLEMPYTRARGREQHRGGHPRERRASDATRCRRWLGIEEEGGLPAPPRVGRRGASPG